jgi:hypothetical protein
MAFDYGVPEEDLKGTPGLNLKVWPTDGECTALIDADAIPYIVGYTSTEQEYLKFKRDGMFDSRVWKDKRDHANYLINSWTERAGCDSALLYLTFSESNFRNDIGTLKKYKGQRKTEKPPFFYEIKSWIANYHDAKVSDGCEADDDISIEAWRRHKLFHKEHGNLWSPMHKKFSDFVIVSKDKDLKIIPGMHLPPDTDPVDKVWVDPIGWLEPKYKEREVIDYEYWPTFDGEAINPKHLVALVNYQGKIQPRKYAHLECPKNKWEQDYVWHSFDGRFLVKQDTFTRGQKKGIGKFKRIAMGKKKSNVLDKLSGAGLSFFYAQLLTGDSVDNYGGIPGIGPKKAYDILLGASTEQELCERVSQAYLQHYRKPELALEMMTEQGRLAWMQTEEGELWSIPSSNSQIFPL